MRKGFTLIELLAVIVILAIIAVIAVPIVINIIDESKENSSLRSAEMYLDAVELAVANRVMHHGAIPNNAYPIMSDGNICLKYEENNTTCEDKLIIEVKGEKPTSGTIVIENGEIANQLSEDPSQKTELVISEKTIVKNTEDEFVYLKTLEEVCTFVENGVTEKTAGAKYECKVDPNKEPYTFYVLTTPKETDTSINLIMERNICIDGTPTDKDKLDKCLVAWITKEDYMKPEIGGTEEEWDIYGDECGNNNKGPITALNFLTEATKNWTNTNKMIINSFNSYDKEGNLVDNLLEMKIYNMYARLPYYNEVSTYDTIKNNVYLYEYLSGEDWRYDPSTKPTNSISEIKGYWLFSGYANSRFAAWSIYYKGNLNFNNGVYNNVLNGVRPVINLKL